jgi:hypothetical protein
MIETVTAADSSPTGGSLFLSKDKNEVNVAGFNSAHPFLSIVGSTAVTVNFE